VTIRHSESGHVLSEREAYMYAISNRLREIELQSHGEQKAARSEPLHHLRQEYEVISRRFERKNRELEAAGKNPLPEATLRPEFVKALHAAQDKAETSERPLRSAAVRDLNQLDRELLGIQRHYEKHSQKETVAQKEPSRKQSQRQQR
jgi:hypothetical protein